MNGRLIAIGDIHGCHLEFSEMIERLSLNRDDRVVMLDPSYAMYEVYARIFGAQAVGVPFDFR